LVAQGVRTPRADTSTEQFSHSAHAGINRRDVPQGLSAGSPPVSRSLNAESATGRS